MVSPTPEVPRQHKEPERTRTTEPIQIVRIMPVQPVFIREAEHKPEVPNKLVELPPKPEVETSKPAKLEVPPADVKGEKLTPVKEPEPEKINEKLTNPPQNVNFSPTRPLKKLPQKMKFKGKPGRQRTEAQVEELLTYTQARNGVFPNGISDQMQRYYRREYPEYFRKGKRGKKVQTHRSKPIDISARRSGTNA